MYYWAPLNFWTETQRDPMAHHTGVKEYEIGLRRADGTTKYTDGAGGAGMKNATADINQTVLTPQQSEVLAGVGRLEKIQISLSNEQVGKIELRTDPLGVHFPRTLNKTRPSEGYQALCLLRLASKTIVDQQIGRKKWAVSNNLDRILSTPGPISGLEGGSEAETLSLSKSPPRSVSRQKPQTWSPPISVRKSLHSRLKRQLETCASIAPGAAETLAINTNQSEATNMTHTGQKEKNA
ncbi:hypothetical protein RRG08_053967 [Elysia crispata]|uniref:Uncharacterized protein n=1 Tax=Elysia crispata TaxID=231223 RepID=A0AAE0ZEA0_9GAST|nr:hypothetical protein RRG08_053967 [Elysia crispata]